MADKKQATKGRKAPIGSGSHPLTFRINDALHSALMAAAAAASRSMNDEARHRLAQSVEIERLSGGDFDLGDAALFARYASILKTATVDAGDDSGRWIAYAGRIPLMVDMDNPAEIERVREAVRSAIDDFIKEAQAFLDAHGIPPEADKPVRVPAGTPTEVREQLMLQQAMHRFYARKHAEILCNRAAAAARQRKAKLQSDPEFMSQLKNKGATGHAEAVEQWKELQRALDAPAQLQSRKASD